MYRRLRITACSLTALVALASACSGDDAVLPDRFTLSLALDNGVDGSCEADTTCGQFPISCGAVVGVRLLDLPPSDPMEEPAVRESACVRVPEGESALTLCDLGRGSLSVSFERIPRENGQVEVVVWPDLDPDADPECPALTFDRFGRVRSEQFDPVNPERPAEPSFARREFFDFSGEDAVATVRLGCHNPDLIGPSCRPISTHIESRIFSIQTPGLSITSSQAEDLDVRVGEPLQISETEHEIQDTTRLMAVILEPLFAPLFEAIISGQFSADEDVCVLVRDLGQAQTVTTTECTRIPSDDALSVMLQGTFIDRDFLNQILDAAQLDAFPLEGVVVGRVIDSQTFQGIAGASVIPNNGSEVRYLDQDAMTSAGLTVTSSSGYFVSTDAPFPTLWTAERGDGLASQTPPPRGGLLRNNVTVVILRMKQTIPD